jgi:hypothetical protein
MHHQLDRDRETGVPSPLLEYAGVICRAPVGRRCAERKRASGLKRSSTSVPRCLRSTLRWPNAADTLSHSAAHFGECVSRCSLEARVVTYLRGAGTQMDWTHAAVPFEGSDWSAALPRSRGNPIGCAGNGRVRS